MQTTVQRLNDESVGKDGAKGQKVALADSKKSVGTPAGGRCESEEQSLKAESGRSEVQRASTPVGSASCGRRRKGEMDASKRTSIFVRRNIRPATP